MNICLCMIVKNESKVIKRCLDSVKEIIDSWCIIDTGSTDDTKEIIKKELSYLPGKLIESTWVNFGYNRTQAYKSIENLGDWALLIDADMVVENLGFKKNQLDSRAEAYTLLQKNGSLKYQNIRFINLKKQWKCIGVTHEYWDCENPGGIRPSLSTLVINDLGDGGAKGDKFTRDIALLIKGIQDEPQNIRYKFYLAQSYKDIGDFEAAIPWYEHCAETSKWPEEAWYSEYMKLKCMVNLKKPLGELEIQGVKAWIKRPWRMEPLYLLGTIYRDEKKWQHAYNAFKACSTIEYPKDDVLFIEYSIYEGVALDELSVAAYWIGKLKESIEIIDGLMKTQYGKLTTKRLKINRDYAIRALSQKSR